MASELQGLFSGKLERIAVLERGASPRIVRARVIGSTGSTAITGDTLRNRLGLRSTWATVHATREAPQPGGIGRGSAGANPQPSEYGCSGIPWFVSRIPSS